MTTFTWNPTSLGQLVSWNTPLDWLPAEVPNASDADVVVPLITQSGNPYPFTIQIAGGESYVEHSVSVTDSTLWILGTLSIVAGLTLAAGSGIEMNGTLSFGSFVGAAGVDIEGSGEVTSTGTVDNQGAIGGLTFDLAGLQNDGTLVGSLVVNLMGGAAAFTNLADGTLTGGTYDTSGGTQLLNVAAAITTDAATLEFIGGGTIETADGGIGQTLTAIASDGVLVLSNGTFQVANALSDAGLVTLDQGTLPTSGLTIDAGGTVVGIGTITGPVTDGGLIIAGPYGSGLLALSGGLSGAGSITIAAAAATLAPSYGGTLELGGAVAATITLDDNNGVLIIDDPAQFAGTIDGFAVGPDLNSEVHPQMTIYVSDTLILPGVSIGAIIGKQYNPGGDGGTLVLQEATGSIALQFAGTYDLGDFAVAAGPQLLSTSPPSVMITEVVPCFVEGTRILTVTGEVPVEALRIGAALPTLRGAAGAPVRWLGHRHVDCASHPRPHEVWPVRVRAGAFRPGMPHRDLWLSPDHAVYIDGALIPIRYLVNGASIAQQEVDEVIYWHVELPRHGVILAEGLPCESYLDTGNRDAFANGGAAVKGCIGGIVAHQGGRCRVTPRIS